MSELAARYRRFAKTEAYGRSPLYEAFSLAVAESAAAHAFLMVLPPQRRQPNLLLGAVRHLCGVARDGGHFLELLLANTEAVRGVMLTRTTQTNEPARCATLLPVLALLPQPLALIEVGASAGLCLLPDLYGYDYGHLRIESPAATAPLFTCAASADTPLPAGMPRVVWRAGLDLNPLDPADDDQTAWLETLVWPEQTHRLVTLRAALGLARAQRPRVVQGDLLGDDLARLCAAAPREATLVIFHTAVLAYVTELADRERFAARAMSLGDYWICNESAGVFPAIADRAGPVPPGRFLLSVNGAPVAWTEPHGATIDWIADDVTALETARLRLRAPRPEDAAELAALVTPEVSRWVATWPHPFTEIMAAERIAATRAAIAAGRALCFVIERKPDGAVLGWIGVTRAGAEDRTAMLGYWLGEAHHGQGYMREAAAAVTRAALRRMRLEVLEAAAQADNAASFAVMRGCGMRQVGERMIQAPGRRRDERCIVYAMAPS